MKNSVAVKISLLLFCLGFCALILSIYFYTNLCSHAIFITASLLLATSLLVFLAANFKRSSTVELSFLILLFLVSVVKVSGLYIKYGIFLGADAFAEFPVINKIIEAGSVPLNSPLGEFPLSMVAVSSLSMLLGISPIAGSWNLLHILSFGLISIAVYFFVREILDSRFAIISATVVAFHPTNTIYGLSMTRENFALLFLMLSIYLISLSLTKRARGQHVVLFLIFVTGLVTSHYATAYWGITVICLIFFLACIFYFRERDRLRSFYIIMPVVILFAWWSQCVLHYGDVRIAYSFLMKMWDLITFKGITHEPITYELSFIESTPDLTALLFIVQAMLLSFGCLVLLVSIAKYKLTKNQIIYAFVAIYALMISGIWYLVPDLSASFMLSRVLRFTIMFNCIAIAALLIFPLSMFRSSKEIAAKSSSWRPKKFGNIRFRRAISLVIATLVILIVFVYPISETVSKYIGFSDDTYPSKLNDEMYNIRSTNEIRTLGFLSQIVPEGGLVILEFPMANALGLHGFRGKALLMDNTTLFGADKYDTDNGTYVFLRRSLFQYGNYIYYPPEWLKIGPYAATLQGNEFHDLTRSIFESDSIYTQKNYRIIAYFRN